MPCHAMPYSGQRRCRAGQGCVALRIVAGALCVDFGLALAPVGNSPSWDLLGINWGLIAGTDHTRPHCSFVYPL